VHFKTVYNNNNYILALNTKYRSLFVLEYAGYYHQIFDLKNRFFPEQLQLWPFSCQHPHYIICNPPPKGGRDSDLVQIVEVPKFVSGLLVELIGH
jgi:hypothetical protein